MNVDEENARKRCNPVNRRLSEINEALEKSEVYQKVKMSISVVKYETDLLLSTSNLPTRFVFPQTSQEYDPASARLTLVNLNMLLFILNLFPSTILFETTANTMGKG